MKTWLIVHSLESFGQNPRMIGFAAKVKHAVIPKDIALAGFVASLKGLEPTTRCSESDC